ncbi:hypothetical protein J8273_2104 [Carpediemonas membranifera]|uniref:PSP proline-rich domain-containing protein n=1 Tax=Carpediemonas membranifera TaxID=201153 RepID=A0A8J6AX67_9EUKA|nr:hypothetical protein J8273_2104 [Carpediemonas membranifera]|eukprot:KAG9396373.1 hypothetical protein J8273_2104 [Carpediemonas membranifera]
MSAQDRILAQISLSSSIPQDIRDDITSFVVNRLRGLDNRLDEDQDTNAANEQTEKAHTMIIHSSGLVDADWGTYIPRGSGDDGKAVFHRTSHFHGGKFARFWNVSDHTPGEMSEALIRALRVGPRAPPEFVWRMRQHGPPPAYSGDEQDTVIIDGEAIELEPLPGFLIPGVTGPIPPGADWGPPHPVIGDTEEYKAWFDQAKSRRMSLHCLPPYVLVFHGESELRVVKPEDVATADGRKAVAERLCTTNWLKYYRILEESKPGR